MPAIAHACNMVVGCILPCQSGVIFGTSMSRPSTLIFKVSTGGGAGFGSVVVSPGISGFRQFLDKRFVLGAFQALLERAQRPSVVTRQERARIQPKPRKNTAAMKTVLL